MKLGFEWDDGKGKVNIKNWRVIFYRGHGSFAVGSG